MKAIATLFAGLFAVSVFAADAPKKDEKKAEAKPAAATPATPAPAPKAEAKKEAAKKWSGPRAYVKTFKKPNDFDEDDSIELYIALARNLKRIEIEEEEEELNDDIKNKLKLFRMLALLKYDGYNLKNGI